MARSPAIAPTSGGGGSDPTLTSTLGDIVDTTSPYSYAPTLTHTGTVLTTITRASDSSSVSVSGSTTTTPTATCTAADAVVGDSFHCESVATDGGITKTLVTTVFMEGTGGGSAYDVSPPAATTEATASGVALGAKTFSAFTGSDAGLIDGYTARTVNAVGSTSWSGSGLGAYTPSGGADADAGVLALDATIGGVVVATALHDYSRSDGAGAAGTLAEILNIDWAALHAANGDYDFLADGPGGDGTHTYGGYTFELSGSATAVTKLEVISTGLDMDQGAGGAFVLGVDCRAVSPAIDPTGLARCIGIWASAVSDASGDGVQVGLRRNASIGTWEVADTAIRYREADATPDLYSISYNGSTHDVLASGTLTANTDVRMQVDLDNFYGTIARGDTGTATDPADSDTLQEFSRASYGSALASFTGTYPGTTSYWAYLGAGGDCHGVATRLIVYGLEA